MLNQENLQSIREGDIQKEKGLNVKIEDLKKNHMADLQRKYESVKRKMKELLDRKQELLQAPMTKSEVLDLSKRALREYRKEYSLEAFLIPHFRRCQERRGLPLDPRELMMVFGRENFWKLAYWIITEKDLEKAMALLPDDLGLSATERDAQIKAIDKEVSDLESQIEEELKGHSQEG